MKAIESESASFLFGTAQEAVAGFQPRAEDLDYPGKLLRAQAAAAGNPEEAQEETPQQTLEQRPLLVDKEDEKVDGAGPAVSGQVGIEGRIPQGTVSWRMSVKCLQPDVVKGSLESRCPLLSGRQLQKESAMDTYAAWFPSVQQTVLCLSKLYRCVEPRVFAGLAQDAVTSCTASVQVPPANQDQRMG